jgi:hypothetical protein
VFGIRSPQLPCVRNKALLAAALLVVLTTAPLLAQAPPAPIDLTHPYGFIRMIVMDPAIYSTSATALWTRPAGRFQLLTGPVAPRGGNPTRVGDEDRTVAGSLMLLNNNAISTTNMTSISIDGLPVDITDLMDAAPTAATVSGLESFWLTPLRSIDNVRIVDGTARIPLDAASPTLATQFLTVRHTFTMIHDMLKVEYVVTNTGQFAFTHNVGMRIMVDPTFGAPSVGVNDGQPIVLPNGTAVTTEAVIPSAAFPGLTVPNSWVSADDQSNPFMVLKGLIKTPDILLPGSAQSSAGMPDEVQFGQAIDMAVPGQYNFIANPSAPLTGQDWAYAVRWNERPLAPNASRRYVTYFGLGAGAGDYASPNSLVGYAPFTLVSTPGPDPTVPGSTAEYHLTDQSGASPFKVSAYIDNFDSPILTTPTVRISLPEGLELYPAGQSLTLSAANLVRNQVAKFEWTVRATSARPGPAPIEFVSGAKRVTFTVNIPAIPTLNPLTSPSGLEMVSIPFQFYNTDVEHVFQSFGAFDISNYAFIRYSPTDMRYHFFPETGATNVNPGEGFWLLNRPRTVAQLPSDYSPVPTTIGFPVAVKHGWNQIGNPFTQTIRFDAAQVIDSGSQIWTLQQASDRHIVIPALFSYNPVANQYEWAKTMATIKLDPYVGYWLYAYRDATIVFNPPTVFSPSAAASAVVKQTPPPVSPNNWQVPLVVSAAGMTRSDRAFGVNTAGVGDFRDLPSPPVMKYGQMLTADFYKDAGGVGAPYLTDCHTTSSATHSWHFAVDTNVPNQEVTVSWPDLTQLPQDYIATLEDPATGQRRYMRTCSSYSFNPGANPGQRLLNIVVQPRPAAGAAAITNVTTAQTGGGSVEFAYTLASPANVDITIRNISGIPVKRLVTDALRDAGANTAAWSCQSDRGLPVPSGRYIVEMTARSPENGMQSAVVRTFQVNR